jgi:ubiquinone/menaquinone biosynthesis C-methylase UbiE
MSLKQYGQYKYDIFTKLNFPFEKRKSLLDVGCGDGSDVVIFQEEYDLNVSAIDVYTHANISTIKNLAFQQAGIYNIPYKDNSFDYIFLHDVLHHIDEENQSYEKHIQGLAELLRVVKPGGAIIIVEGNRYNPLFYPHMVKMHHHEHFSRSYFRKIIKNGFEGNSIKFRSFEAHFYPSKWIKLWKAYEWVMENIVPPQFLSYNIAIITKK